VVVVVELAVKGDEKTLEDGGLLDEEVVVAEALNGEPNVNGLG